ncbi:DNA topoisomerase 2 [Trichoglossum hirsutum]|uniref:DNA topoisomerase 2 n=1 Tax=Trichoglossum hirsutum TaxID=265104 RepID=A0A9P8LCV4_9PEZI|nr:DNA topoisomerase 2 [Trichoglossum hirsutum]
MDDSIFDVDGDSSDFAPVHATKLTATTPAQKPKPKAAPKKATAAKPKAVPKKMVQTTIKTKPATSKKRAKTETDEEDGLESDSPIDDGSHLSHTPPSAKKQKKAPVKKKTGGRPLEAIENDGTGLDGSSDAVPKKGASSTDKYQKLTQLEHILKRPDTYIGSVERTDSQMWVYNSQSQSMELRSVSVVPGLYKIFDEILVNAADNKQRDKNMDAIKVTINREKGEISVWNNGRGIPIEVHDKEGIYIPEMIFGHLLTSSNYDDDQEKVTGGRNGYGAKLCNIFSREFVLETADSKTKKKYKQVWRDNMSRMEKAKITANKGDDFTMVTFMPDFEKFGMSGMDDDFEALVMRRVYDLAGTTRGVKVSLNGERIKIRNFKQYMDMYVKAINKEKGGEAENDPASSTLIHEIANERWEIGFAVSDGTFQQVSFVNSIATTSGGTHVNYISDQIVNRLMEAVKKKNKGGYAVKNHQIRNHLFLFVNCLVSNPAFTSQTKEQMTTKASAFGSKCVVSDEFLKKVAKTEVVANILDFANKKADQALKKTDGGRRNRMSNPKLIDANKAGTKDGWRCTLILTEGDSAKGLAVAGRSVVGPDLFGVFPLRGKLLNVRDASIDQIAKNVEIQNIKQFIGLQHKKEYTDTKSLRYGHLMIMTDQDHDGSHIKGLLINFLQVQFPSLLRIPGFLVEFITPIVKVYKGDPKRPRQSKSFFTMPEYEAFKEEHRNENWEHKYYKGLGTSAPEDALIYFHDLDRHLKEFHTMQEEETQLIDLAFSKKKADERKEWLRQFKPGTYLDHGIDKISYTDFINKELILFSMADNMRSIPSVIDGLKPGQRKVLYTCFRRNLKKDMKVVELAGLVSGLTAYQHGETSLQQTIVGLAQTFVGSNNINCLEPSGNFGSRLQGGSDTASARYIYTRLSPFARRIFSPLDEPLLTFNTDDEKTIEPEIYVPVIPLVLVNGADGIGTGWSSSIPNYNPEDIVDNLRRLLRDEEMVPMTPWFRGWTGEVKQTAPDRYKFSGVIKQVSETEVEITELPIRVWTQDFKDKLEEVIKAEKIPSFIKDYVDYNTHVKVHFIVQMDEKHMKIAIEEGLEEKFKLSKSIATSNLVAFDPEGRIHKYASVEDIMKEFYQTRLRFYQKRKAHQLSEMQKELEKLSNQARFVKMIIDGTLVVAKKKKTDLVAELKQKHFKPFPKVKQAVKGDELEPLAEKEEDTSDEMETEASAYDYLLGMAIWSLTKERVEKLLQQIGEKEEQVDAFLKLSPKDLWTKDLDDFIAEWRFQLEDEENRAKNAAKKGRRASTKLKLGSKAPTLKKRKAGGDSDDSDFAVPQKKAGVVKRVQPKAISAFNYLKTDGSAPVKSAPKPTAKAAPTNQGLILDGPSSEVSGSDPGFAAISKKAKTADAKTKASGFVELDESISEIPEVVKPPTRKPRAAASRPIRYEIGSEDSDDGKSDDALGDVSKLVKGLGGPSSNTGPGSRSLFSNSKSRLSMNVGSSKVKVTGKPVAADLSEGDDIPKTLAKPPQNTAAAKPIEDNAQPDGADDTVEAPAKGQEAKPPGRAPKTSAPKKSVPKKTNGKPAPIDLSDDDAPKILTKPSRSKVVTKPTEHNPPSDIDDSMDILTTDRQKKPSSRAPKPKHSAQAPAKKPAATATAPKKLELSPVAKAYAAKQAKKKIILSEDEDDEDDDAEAIANDILDSPGRDVGVADSSPPARATSSRPSRRAATAQRKPAYFDDDSEDEESEQEDTEDFSNDDD